MKADKALSADGRTRQCVILRFGVASPADVRTCRDICIVDGSRVHFRGLSNRATGEESRDDGLLAEDGYELQPEKCIILYVVSTEYYSVLTDYMLWID